MTASMLPPATYAPRGADATREKLLQATHELLIERAGSEPSVSQICERAGVRAGMVSYCFGGKAQMLEALVERIRDGVKAELDRLAALDLPPQEKLRHNIRAMVRNFVRFPYGVQLSERLRAGHPHGERIATVFGAAMVPFYAGLLEEGVRDGVFREIDPRLLFVSIAGMADYFSGARSLFPRMREQELIERFTDHTIELLLDGLRARVVGDAASPGAPTT